MQYRVYFSSERRHYFTFHPRGLFRCHWLSMFTFLFTFYLLGKCCKIKIWIYLESVTGYKFGFELGSKFGLKLNLNWNFEVFF